MSTFTVLASDKPGEFVCSRCGAALTGRVVTAEWNGLRFAYCSTCLLKAEPPHA